MKSRKILISVVVLALLVSVVAVLSASAAPSAAPPAPKAKFSTAVAFDKTPALRDMTRSATPRRGAKRGLGRRATRHPTRARPGCRDRGFSGDGAIQGAGALRAAAASAAATIPARRELRRLQQPGQFQPVRLPRQSPRSGRAMSARTTMWRW